MYIYYIRIERRLTAVKQDDIIQEEQAQNGVGNKKQSSVTAVWLDG